MNCNQAVFDFFLPQASHCLIDCLCNHGDSIQTYIKENDPESIIALSTFYVNQTLCHKVIHALHVNISETKQNIILQQ